MRSVAAASVALRAALDRCQASTASRELHAPRVLFVHGVLRRAEGVQRTMCEGTADAPFSRQRLGTLATQMPAKWPVPTKTISSGTAGGGDARFVAGATRTGRRSRHCGECGPARAVPVRGRRAGTRRRQEPRPSRPRRPRPERTLRVEVEPHPQERRTLLQRVRGGGREVVAEQDQRLGLEAARHLGRAELHLHDAGGRELPDGPGSRVPDLVGDHLERPRAFAPIGGEHHAEPEPPGRPGAPAHPRCAQIGLNTPIPR